MQKKQKIQPTETSALSVTHLLRAAVIEELKDCSCMRSMVGKFHVLHKTLGIVGVGDDPEMAWRSARQFFEGASEYLRGGSWDDAPSEKVNTGEQE